MSTALVLEGGGMRGVYTCGVLDYFMDSGIKFPRIYGVSAGAGHAMSYVSWQRGRALRVGTKYVNDWRYCSARSLITTGDLFGAKFIYETIPYKLDPYDYYAFNNSDMKLIATCSDVETGKAIYVPIDDAKRDIIYVRASSSLPLLSRIVKTPRGKLLDGGCCDSIPIRHALSENERAVTVLTQPEGFVKQPSSSIKAIKLRYARYPKFVEANAKRHEDYNASLSALEAAKAEGKAFIIRPSEPAGFGRIEKDVSKLMRLYEMGYNDAKASGIEKFLGI